MLWKKEQKIQRKDQKSKQITAGTMGRKIVSVGRKMMGVALCQEAEANLQHDKAAGGC